MLPCGMVSVNVNPAYWDVKIFCYETDFFPEIPLFLRLVGVWVYFHQLPLYKYRRSTPPLPLAAFRGAITSLPQELTRRYQLISLPSLYSMSPFQESKGLISKIHSPFGALPVCITRRCLLFLIARDTLLVSILADCAISLVVPK